MICNAMIVIIGMIQIITKIVIMIIKRQILVKKIVKSTRRNYILLSLFFILSKKMFFDPVFEGNKVLSCFVKVFFVQKADLV